MQVICGNETLTPVSVDFSDVDHGGCLLEKLMLQRKLRSFCDVIVHLDSHEFPVHQNVLAACSPYFESILSRAETSENGEQDQQRHVSLNCGDSKTFETILSYMYTGRITVDRNNVADVLRLANFLVIPKLKEVCSDYLHRGITTSNCFQVRDIAVSNGLSVLLKTVEAFIFAHVSELIDLGAALELSEPKLEFVISRSMPLVEIQRVRLICAWVGHTLNERKKRLPSLLTHVAWQRVGAMDLCHFLRDTALLLENEFCMYHVLQSLKDSCLLPDIYFDKLNALRNKVIAPSATSDDDAAHDMHSTDTHLSDTFDPAYEYDKASVVSDSTVIVDLSDVISFDRASEDFRSDGVKIKSESTSLKRKTRSSETSLEETAQRKSKRAKTIEKSERGATDVSRKKLRRITEERSERTLKRKKENAGTSGADAIRKNSRKTLLRKRCKNYVIEIVPEEEEEEEEEVPVKTKRSRKPRGSPRYTCSKCPFSTLNPDKLRVHTNASHRFGTKFECKHCRFTCSWNRQYYLHMKKHYAGPPFVCDHCGFSSDRVQALLVHQMNHSDERPYECKTCGMKFKMKNNLASHSRGHSGEKPFVCPVCNRSFATKGTMEQHVVTHSNQRPYLCDKCGFSTKYQSHLIAHKRLHTGDVFKCQFMNCEYSTPKRSQLACHMRTHMHIRSHTCTVCGKSFVEKSHLVRHERVHLDDKPFKCERCDYSSTRRDKLKEHKAKYHEETSTARMAYRPRKSRQPGVEEEKSAKKPTRPRLGQSAKKSKEGAKKTTDLTTDGGDMLLTCEPASDSLQEAPSASSDPQRMCQRQLNGATSSVPLNMFTAVELIPLQTNRIITTIQISPVQDQDDNNCLRQNVVNLNSNNFAIGHFLGNGPVRVVSNGHVTGDLNHGQVMSQIIDLSAIMSNGHLEVISSGQQVIPSDGHRNGTVNGHVTVVSDDQSLNEPCHSRLNDFTPVQVNGISSLCEGASESPVLTSTCRLMTSADSCQTTDLFVSLPAAAAAATAGDDISPSSLASSQPFESSPEYLQSLMNDGGAKDKSVDNI